MQCNSCKKYHEPMNSTFGIREHFKFDWSWQYHSANYNNKTYSWLQSSLWITDPYNLYTGKIGTFCYTMIALTSIPWGLVPLWK